MARILIPICATRMLLAPHTVRMLVTCGIVVAALVAAARADEFGQILAEAKLSYSPLSDPNHSLSPEKQREFDTVWQATGVAARDVQEQWAHEIAKDELLQAALDGYQRAEKADEIYCDAREKLRNRFGLDKFNKLEAKLQPWILTRGMPWIDSQDNKLLRIYTWYLLFLNGAPGENFWSGFDAKAFAQANESRRVDIIKSHLQTVRTSKSLEAQELEREIDSIPLMRRYLVRRDEADGLHEICGEYLSQKGIGKTPEILAAEEKFVKLEQKAYDIWPGVGKAFAKAHPERIPDELKNEFEEQLKDESQ